MLFSSAFRFTNPALAFARARLFTDRIELTGWQIQGRYRRSIPLNQVLQVDCSGGPSLLLWLSSGETLRLRVADPGLWKATIEACRA